MTRAVGQRRVAGLCIVLFSVFAMPVFASEISHLPYRYSSDMGVAIETTETFVLCDCKPGPELAVKPNLMESDLQSTNPLWRTT